MYLISLTTIQRSCYRNSAASLSDWVTQSLVAIRTQARESGTPYVKLLGISSSIASRVLSLDLTCV